MTAFTQHLPPDPDRAVAGTLALTADECRKSRFPFKTVEGREVRLDLPRGTVLRRGDLVCSPDTGECLRVEARPEPVMTVTAPDAHALLRGAYHLGNRHVALEVGRDYLRFEPDPVLAGMVVQLGLSCREEVAPFEPEAGAYHGQHGHHGH